VAKMNILRKHHGWLFGSIFAVFVALMFLIPTSVVSMDRTLGTLQDANVVTPTVLTATIPGGGQVTGTANTVTLQDGFQLPVKGGPQGLANALSGGALAPALQSAQGLRQVEIGLQSPQYKAQVAAIPSYVWATLEKTGQDALHGASKSVLAADMRPLVSGSAILGVAEILVVFTLLGCAFGPWGCIAGFVIGAGIELFSYLAGSIFQNYNAQRYAAGVQMETIMAGLNNLLLNNANSTRTILNDLNTTYVALTWEAANAALSQLPNGTFNYALDAEQSGIPSQLASTATGVIGNMAGAITSYFNGTGQLFGPNGFYGAQGIACTMQLQTTAFGGSSQVIDDPNLYMGFSPSSPDCYGEIGTVGNEQWSGTGNPSVSPGVYAGEYIGDPGTSSGAESLDSEYYVPTGAPFDQAFTQGWTGRTTGPYTGLQFVPATGTGTTWFNYTTPTGSGVVPTSNGALNFTGPTGIYYINSLASCATTAFSSCHPSGGAVHPPAIIGVGLLPVTDGTTGYTALGASFNLTGPSSGDTINAVPIVCGAPSAGMFTSTVTAPETNAQTVHECDAASMYTLTEMSTLLQASLNVGDTYWAFLRAQGYYNENQVPARCVIPNPADIIAPNVKGGAAYLASLNATQLLALYLSYLASLAHTFNSTANLTTFGFCGHTVRCPSGSTNLTTCESLIGLGQTPVIALGNIYVPPAQCVADIGHACNGESINVPSTWGIVGVQMLWEPSTGTFTAILNQTIELPYANPLQLMYTDNNSAGNNLTCATGKYNVYSCEPKNPAVYYGIPNFFFHVTGNSSLSEGSIYPNDLVPADGVGFATDITGCASISLSNFSGNWLQAQNYTWQHSVCQFNETEIQSWVTNDSCFFDTASCIPPTPPPPDTAGDCGVAGFFGTNILGPIASTFVFFGTGIACDIAWVIVIVVTIFIVALVIWALSKATSGRSGRTGGSWS
jgi:hypothetical protein